MWISPEILLIRHGFVGSQFGVCGLWLFQTGFPSIELCAPQNGSRRSAGVYLFAVQSRWENRGVVLVVSLASAVPRPGGVQRAATPLAARLPTNEGDGRER